MEFEKSGIEALQHGAAEAVERPRRHPLAIPDLLGIDMGPERQPDHDPEFDIDHRRQRNEAAGQRRHLLVHPGRLRLGSLGIGLCRLVKLGHEPLKSLSEADDFRITW